MRIAFKTDTGIWTMRKPRDAVVFSSRRRPEFDLEMPFYFSLFLVADLKGEKTKSGNFWRWLSAILTCKSTRLCKTPNNPKQDIVVMEASKPDHLFCTVVMRMPFKMMLIKNGLGSK